MLIPFLKKLFYDYEKKLGPISRDDASYDAA